MIPGDGKALRIYKQKLIKSGWLPGYFERQVLHNIKNKGEIAFRDEKASRKTCQIIAEDG